LAQTSAVGGQRPFAATTANGEVAPKADRVSANRAANPSNIYRPNPAISV
jgi:hypothetical protein